MNKRILAIIISICTLLSFANAGMVCGAEDYSVAVELLNGLSIGDISDQSAVISRGQFAGIISDVLNYSLRPSLKNGVFEDVTKDYKYSGAIYSLNDRGIVSGYDSKTFKPDAPILKDQAVKILVSALGYDDVAKRKGGYPAGYTMVAFDIGVLKKNFTTSGDALTCGEAAELVANALDAEILIQTNYGDVSGYTTYEGATLMTEYMDIEKVEGVVTDNGITALTGDSTIPENYVRINGEAFNAKTSGACDYLGMTVDAYVTMNYGTTADEVVYVTKNSDVNIITIKAHRLLPNDSKFSDTNIVYEDLNGKIRNEKVDSGADFIYNGKAYTDLREDDLKITAGELKLIDNDRNGKYEVVMVENARTVVVSGVNYDTETVYDKNKGEPLAMSEVDTYTIIKEGKSIQLSNIGEWDVITAYISRDKKNMELRVSSEKITDYVKALYNDTLTAQLKGGFFQIGNEDVFDLIKIGQEYEFCLDVEGNIVAVVNYGRYTDSVGYFIKAKAEPGLTGKAMVKIFTTRGEHITCDFAERASVDGNRNMKPQEIVDYLNTNAANKLVNYKLDKENKVEEIILPFVGTDIPAEDAGKLQLVFDSGTALIGYSQNARSFVGKLILSDDVKIFQVPVTANPDDADDGDFSIRTPEYFGNRNGFAIQAYKIGEEDGKTDFIIHKANVGREYNHNSYPVVVKNITKVVGDDGMDRTCLIGYGQIGEVEWYTYDDSMLEGVVPGDIVRCPRTLQDEILEVRKVFDYATKKVVSEEEIGVDFFENCRSFVGDVYCRYNTMVGITNADMEYATIEQANESLELHELKSAKIYKVSNERGVTVSIATADDIYDYLRVGNDCSKAFLHTYQGGPKMLVVYSK